MNTNLRGTLLLISSISLVTLMLIYKAVYSITLWFTQ